MLRRTIKEVARSLALVTASRPDLAEGEEARGTAFVIGAGGLLATAYHLVRRATAIKIQGIGRPGTLTASLIGSHEGADVALLRVMADDLEPARLHDGPPVALGADVAFMGFPYADVFEPPLAMTARGIVGNRYRGGGIERYVVDAICAEGLSGAPLFLCETGRVIGLVSGRFDPALTRARLRGATLDELDRIPRTTTGITFAADHSYLAELLAKVGRPKG